MIEKSKSRSGGPGSNGRGLAEAISLGAYDVRARLGARGLDEAHSYRQGTWRGSKSMERRLCAQAVTSGWVGGTEPDRFRKSESSGGMETASSGDV